MLIIDIKHFSMNVFQQFKKGHFTIWMLYFFGTIYAFFNVANASLMKRE